MISKKELEEIQLTADCDPVFISEAVAIDHLKKLLEERKQLVAIAEWSEIIIDHPIDRKNTYIGMKKALKAWKGDDETKT